MLQPFQKDRHYHHLHMIQTRNTKYRCDLHHYLQCLTRQSKPVVQFADSNLQPKVEACLTYQLSQRRTASSWRTNKRLLSSK